MAPSAAGRLGPATLRYQCGTFPVRRTVDVRSGFAVRVNVDVDLLVAIAGSNAAQYRSRGVRWAGGEARPL